MTTYTVNAGEGSPTGNNGTTTNTLDGAIYAADTGPVANYIINITAGFSFSTDLLAINLPTGSTLTIQGTNGSGGVQVQTLNGNGDQRGLFVYAGNVTVNNLTLTNMQAAGGNGGAGAGGGAGLGGGLFVATAGVVALDNVTFSSDSAKGGNGGIGNGYNGGPLHGTTFAYGAGGGMGGNGGPGGGGLGSVGGGGGVGVGANGGGPNGNGGAGIIPRAGNAGKGGGSGGAGGASGGGGGGDSTSGGGGGGVGGHAGASAGVGGAGGFGGGGGGGSSHGVGGAGGFGGGGAAASAGAAGAGSFGGGGASSFYGNASAGSPGGFGAGSGGKSGAPFSTSPPPAHVSFGGGGGGLAAGGDVFVQQGGSLTIEGGSLGTAALTAGTGGAAAGGGGTSSAGGSGSALGGALFIQGTQTVTFAPASTKTLTISDVITDQSANGGTGHGAVTVDGGGTVVFSANNTYTGGTSVRGGTTLELTATGVAGSSTGGGSTKTITFVSGQTGTLQIDGTTMPTNTIATFATGDHLDLRGLAFVSGATATYNAGTLTVISGGVTKTLSLSSPAQTTFTVVSDGVGVTPGSDIGLGSPPTLSNVAANAAFTEEGSAVTLSPSVTVTDTSSTSLTSATVVISGGTFANDFDVLATSTTGTSITASYNTSTETLTLTGSDTLADYQTVLDRITFSAGENPTDFGSHAARTVTWVVNDGTSASTASTTAVSITNVNDPPTLGNVATSASFTEEGAAATLSSALSVTDPDDVNLASATVSITGGKFSGDGDALGFNTTGTSITASYNTSSETLTLAGNDTLLHYRQVLDQVTFSAGENPTNFGSNPTRTLTWVLNDGSGSFASSTVATSAVSITNVNDPPSLSNVATSAQFTEEAGAVTLSNAVSLGDPDSLDLVSGTVSVTGGAFTGDVLSATGTSSITVSYDSTNERLILTGTDTPANYQTVLDSVTFTAGENPTDFGSDLTRTVTWVLNDGAGSNSLSTAQTTAVSITNVNDAPTLIGVPGNAAGSPSSTITLAPSVTVTDVDDLKLVGATVVVSGGSGDTLAASVAGTNITASYNTTTETLTLSGSDTLADYQTVLDQVTFTATNAGVRTVTWVVQDPSGTANGGSDTSAPATETVTLDSPPTLSGVAASVTWTEEGAVTTLSSGIVVSDPDGVSTDNSATVSITGNTFPNDHDLLSVNTAGTAISASYNSTTETLTLTGSDTLADYQQVLQSVTFSAGENPTDFASSPNRKVTWVIADHVNVDSAPRTTTLWLINVNDPPTLSNVATSAAWTEEASSTVTLSGAVGVSDPDTLTLLGATVSIVGGTFAVDGDVLATTTTGTFISASYNSTSERLILSGPDSAAHYRQVLDAVTFSTAVENPTNFGSDPTRTVTWVMNDGSGSFNLSTAVTTTISITNVNDAPTLGNVATNASYTEEGAAATLSSAVAVSDPDNVNLAGATVRITGGAFAGDVLATSVAGTSITASYNSATETLTLAGADTLADYRQVLDAVTFAAGENPTNFGSNPTRTVTWTLNDGGASNNLSTVVTSTVSVTNVNDPPTLSNVAASAALSTVGQTVALSPALAVSDPDNLTLVNATVSVGGGFTGDGDVLGFNTAGTAILASYNSATETLTLSGTDTLADYQSVLDSVTFTSGANPTNSGANPARTVSWVVNDGSASNNLSAAATTTINFQPLLSFVGIGDFDANSRSDIAWASNGGGKATLWMNTNGTLTQNPVPLGAMGAEWTAYGVGDFNGDGKADILWTNTTGQVAVWEMNGPNLIGFGVAAGQMGSEWHVAAIGDFNGDGKSDVLWTDTGGHAAVFTMNGAVMSGFAVSNGVMGSGWSALGSGDFNRDGRADVLWENTSSGTVDIWEMDNSANLSGFQQNVGTAPGRFAGVGHFTGVSEMGNKTSDIVWVDDTNHVTIWEMSGGHIAQTLNLNGLDGTDWHLEGVGNFAGDTNSDLLWVNKSTGAVNIWEVNGSSVTEIPLNVPTGSTLQLKAGTQSAQQSAPQLMTLSDSDPGKAPHALVGG